MSVTGSPLCVILWRGMGDYRLGLDSKLEALVALSLSSAMMVRNYAVALVRLVPE